MVLLCALFAGTVAHATAPTADDFASGPSMWGGRLSPSGRYLAMMEGSTERAILRVHDLETGATKAIIGAAFTEAYGGTRFSWVGWKDDDRLLVAIDQVEVWRRGPNPTDPITRWQSNRGLFVMRRDGGGIVPLRGTSSQTRYPGTLIDPLRNDPGHVLMTATNSGGGLDAVRVDTVTGEYVTVAEGSGAVLAYSSDRDGNVVARTRRGAASGSIRILDARDPATGAWTEVTRLRDTDWISIPDFQMLGATSRAGEYYVAVKPQASADGHDTRQVHVYDFATRTLGPVVWRNPDYDVDDILQSSDGTLQGGCYWADTYVCEFADAGLRREMEAIQRFFEGRRSVSIVSKSQDDQIWLLKVSGSDERGSYYLYRRATHAVTPIANAYARVPPEALSATTRVDYTARDGTALRGYLTLPSASTAGGRPPLVVLPHGGPEGRDVLDYDMWVQFLASRGYAVFQPQFRGSSGFGRSFAEAGYRQWGLRMQDDVTDGVDAVIRSGSVDGARLCIVGASYGGYVALLGGARQPDLYRCVISIAGVGDLGDMLNWERNAHGEQSGTYRYWVRAIGSPITDAAALDAASPRTYAATYRPPVLLIHGDADKTVPVEQSRAMDRALRRAGHESRLVVLEGEDHNGWYSFNESRVMQEMERFLAARLMAAPSPSPAAP